MKGFNYPVSVGKVLWQETRSMELLENLEVAFFISRGRGSRVGSGCFTVV